MVYCGRCDVQMDDTTPRALWEECFQVSRDYKYTDWRPVTVFRFSLHAHLRRVVLTQTFF